MKIDNFCEGWLGREESNLRMAESKSDYPALYIKGRFEKPVKYVPIPINRLPAASKCVENHFIIEMFSWMHGFTRSNRVQTAGAHDLATPNNLYLVHAL